MRFGQLPAFRLELNPPLRLRPQHRLQLNPPFSQHPHWRLELDTLSILLAQKPLELAAQPLQHPP